MDVTAVSIAGLTRSNIAVVEPDGTLTKINAAGPELSARESALLLDTVRGSAGADWIACCGSLPPGLEDRWYAELVTRAREAGARVALDASGPALAAALPARPDVVKPNAAELAEAVGRPLATLGDAVKAAEELVGRGAGAVLASLGAQGQLLVTADGAHHGTAPVAAVRSDVGAGDAALAGFLTAGVPAPPPSPPPSPTARPPYSCRAASCRARRTCAPRPSASPGTCRWTSRCPPADGHRGRRPR